MKLLELESPEFAYGNTRLRARKSDLLAPADYEAMLGLDVDGLLGALAATAHRPDIEAALPRFHGLRCLHEAVRTHLGCMLEEMRSFYSDSARQLVDVLLSSWDVRNLVTLLRGQVARAPADEVLPLLVPVGGLDEASAREVASQPELAAAVQLLLAWRLPTPEDARALGGAWPAYERSGDLAALEHALAAAHAARAVAAVERAGREAEPLRSALREESDDRNLVIALRFREALADERGEPPAGLGPLLAGGAVDPESLTGAALGPSPEDAAAAVLALPGAGRWSDPLARWAGSGDLVALHAGLEAARARARIALFVSGDPLSIAVPLAFTAATETEARNLRVLGEGAVRGDPYLVRSRLLT